MPDYGFIAQPQVPNAMQTIGQVVNTAQGIQGLQQQRQQIGLTNVQLQAANQANTERVAKQQFFGNPANWQNPDGTINMTKINQNLPQIAPMTAADTIQKFSTLSSAQTAAEQAKLNFTGSERQVVGNLYGVLGRAGIDDPKVVDNALDTLKSQYPDNSSVAKYIDAAKVGLASVPAGKGILPKTLVTQSQALLSPSQQQGQLSPTVGLTSTGGQIVPTVTQPAVGGNAPNIQFSGSAIPTTLPPSQVQTTGTDALGNPIVTTKGPTGNVESVTGAPVAGQPPIKPFVVPPGETPQSVQQLVQTRQNANAAASHVQDQHYANQQILDLIKTHPGDLSPTGPNAALVAKISGYVGSPISSNYADTYNKIAHFLALQTQSNEKAMGVNTDAGRYVSGIAAGSTAQTPQSLETAIHVNDAGTTGLGFFNQGMESAIKAGGIGAVRGFQNEWSRYYDPNAMLLYNAKINNDPKEAQQVIQQLGGVDSPKFKALLGKMAKIEALSKGQL